MPDTRMPEAHTPATQTSGAPAPGFRAAAREAAIRLRLYVTGETPGAGRAIAVLEEVRRELGTDRVTLEIIDVLEDPAAALSDDIYATPTVFRIAPEPVARLFGDLSCKTAVIAGLGLG